MGLVIHERKIAQIQSNIAKIIFRSLWYILNDRKCSIVEKIMRSYLEIQGFNEPTYETSWI
jgi:hypothetical protein